VSAPAAKDEQSAAGRVELQGGLHPSGQPVKTLAHIGHAARQIDAHIPRNADHDSADKTRRSAASSTAPVIRSFTPDGRAASIHPGRRTIGVGKYRRRVGGRRRCRQPAGRRSHHRRRKSCQLAGAKPPVPTMSIAPPPKPKRQNLAQRAIGKTPLS
jgi:hypothetical protein